MVSSHEALGRGLSERLQVLAAPGAAAALISAGEVVWQGSTGVARPSSGRLVDEQTAFMWFSMTKIATATAVMQLIDTGTVGLDSPAREHLSDLDALDARITVRQLLNHSSGIANPPRCVGSIEHPNRGPNHASWSRVCSSGSASRGSNPVTTRHTRTSATWSWAS
jgi:CubicO group peptidase (beta-lactamase class C family)